MSHRATGARGLCGQQGRAGRASAAIAAAHRKFDAAVTDVRAITVDPAEHKMLYQEAAAEDRWQGLTFALMASHRQRRTVLNLFPQRELVETAKNAETRLSAMEIRAASGAQDHAKVISLWLLVLTLLVLGGVIGAAEIRDRTWLRTQALQRAPVGFPERDRSLWSAQASPRALHARSSRDNPGA